MGKPKDLAQGTLGVLILKTVALQPMHGLGESRNASGSFRTKSCKSARARSIRHCTGLSSKGWIQAKW